LWAGERVANSVVLKAEPMAGTMVGDSAESSDSHLAGNWAV